MINNADLLASAGVVTTGRYNSHRLRLRREVVVQADTRPSRDKRFRRKAIAELHG